jgi:hypothetical protein
MARPVDVHRFIRFVVVWALASTGCATGYPFQRPVGTAKPVVRNEVTGKTYEDCRAAFAEATSDTVLTFSDGFFACGPDVAAATGWLVLRGAGLGHTYLEYGDPITDPPKPLRLTAIRPGRYLRVEDLAFGGLTELPGEDGRVELVRAAVASERPALFGGPDAHMEGSAVVVHSVLLGWTGKRPPSDGAPKPIAIGGTERIAILESIAYDVEQEFERFPAPGSIVLLSDGVQTQFVAHQPVAKIRPDPSPRQNVPCGNTHNPAVVCASESQSVAHDTALGRAARALWSGSALSAIEPALKDEAKGFADRFGRSLGAGIRQPDAYWFDDTAARTVEDEAAASTKDGLVILARPRTAAVVAACGRPDQTADSIAAAMNTARTIDHLLAGTTVENACRDALKNRIAGLLTDCKQSWDWAQVLNGVSTVDAALGSGSQQTDECRKELLTRLPPSSERGVLLESYLREVDRMLKLGMPASGAAPIPSLAGVSKALPWIRLRAVRTLKPGPAPTIMDRLIHAAQAEGAGDGRELVELTPPCSLSVATVGTRASTTLQLGELPKNAHTGQTPQGVIEIPVLATQDDLVGKNFEGSPTSAILSLCEQKTNQAFDAAVRRYFEEELQRLLATTSGVLHSDIDVTLELIHQEMKDAPLFKDQPLPRVVAAMAKVGDNIRSQPLDAAQVTTRPEEAPLLLRAPPDWTFSDYELAADQLARAASATLDACELAMPDVPWHRDREGNVRGQVVIDGFPMSVRCQPKEQQFELSVRTEAAVAPKELDTMMRALNTHLGWWKPQKMAGMDAWVWAARPGGRSAVMFPHGKLGNELAVIVVPIGSAWPK